MSRNKNNKVSKDFSRITIGLASPETILEWSNGEVMKPETINYRTYKPEKDGLFCERIFGPVKDYECHCGKYKRIRYKGIVCDRCGVEVTEKKVRRERMGHIELVVPVVHIWYFKSLPNKIGNLLGITSKKLEQIVYYERYVVINPGPMAEEGLQFMDFITEEEYLDYLEMLPKENQLLEDSDPNKFIAKMGADALEMILASLDLDELSYSLRKRANEETSQQRKANHLKRLKIVEAFRSANKHIENRPEWMIIRMVPVIPPEIRPLVPLEGGRFAASDLNDLYKRVIIRNNRLKRLMEIKAPEVILRNEKRMLQEAVDALFDNSRKVGAVRASANRTLKSLSDSLKGKQGRFRQNLLGKRVDYSGRSVIVVGPSLKLHECGLPKNMAAELFKPFIIRKLIERGIVKTVKTAKKIVERKDPVIYDILENVLKGRPVLLNRAPTLHRLGIQAFQPKLVEGKAIQLHPLVCTGFNADFDGDQMAVHVPLGNEAALEAMVLMLSSHNILHPANGAPIVLPTQDMVLGIYYMTKQKSGLKGEGMTFYSSEEVKIAHNENKMDLHTIIKVRIPKFGHPGEFEIIETTIGRVILNEIIPDSIPYVNEVLGKKSLRKVITNIFRSAGMDEAAKFLDNLKGLGFHYAFKGGLSFSIPDVLIPPEKETLITEAYGKIDEIANNYNFGFITDNERYNQVIDTWSKINGSLADILMKQLREHKQGFNPIYMMLDSGARGSKEQIRQLGGMRGLMAKPQKSIKGSAGEIIENPILSNFKEGLSVIEYFISTHGARKGLADTALKTADAGYLTRRLVDVSQDVIVNEHDCGTLRGLAMTALKKNDDIVETLYERILGRITSEAVYHPETNELIIDVGKEVTESIAKAIEDAGVEEVGVRSVLTCESKRGVCAQCYGRNLATHRRTEIGEAVGVIAAQSIGEPGTQLTLRTFHVGGTAQRLASESQILAKHEGKIDFEGLRFVEYEEEGDIKKIVVSRGGDIRIVDEKANVLIAYTVPFGSNLFVEEGQSVLKAQELVNWDPYNSLIISEFEGTAVFENVLENITYRVELDEQTGHQDKVIIETRDKALHPTIKILDVTGAEIRSYSLPVGAHIVCDDNEKIISGKTLAKIPRNSAKTSDITGGLPRVTELFEARNPSNPAVISEIDGIVSYGGIKRAKREVFVTSKDEVEKRKYMIPLSKHILVQENDFVKSGDELSDGATSPVDILNIRGVKAVQEYIVDEIQEVYRTQGVTINAKHIEVIVRQMMQKVKIVDAGDTIFLENEVVNKIQFQEENDYIYDKKVVIDPGESAVLREGMIVDLRKLREENSKLRRNDKKLAQVRDVRPAIGYPILQGITKASLDTSSWMSAASFQETTKVLSSAAIEGKIDNLLGLKENVIVGQLIPAGTGRRDYKTILVGKKSNFVKEEETDDDISFEDDTEKIISK